MLYFNAYNFRETHWWDITPEIPKQLRQAFYQALETKQFVRYEVDVWGRNHGEEIITVDFSLNPVLNDKNEVLYLLAEGRDITEKKSAEALVAQKNQELTVLYERIKVNKYYKSATQIYFPTATDLNYFTIFKEMSR